jgi:hypothetical protein
VKRDFFTPLIGWFMMTTLLAALVWSVNTLAWMNDQNAKALRHGASPYADARHRKYVTGPKVEDAVRRIGEQDPAEVIELENEPPKEAAP